MSVTIWTDGEAGAADLNFANGNFVHLFSDVLDYELGEYLHGELDAMELREKVDLALSAIAQGRTDEFIRPETITRGAHGGTIINCGIDGEYLARRLGEIKALALRGIENGGVLRYA